MSGENQQLNIGRAKPDKFKLILSHLPSSSLISPEGLEESETIIQYAKDLNTFALSLQAVDLPGISIGEIKTLTPFAPISDNEDTIEFDPIITVLRLDDNYIVYKLIVLWIMMMRQPLAANQYCAKHKVENLFVDANLIVRNNFNDSVLEIHFSDFRPLSIETINLDYSNGGDEIPITITWGYSYWLIKNVGGENISLNV
jgi:hypothetical protein